jgi:hypothetical protein
MLASVKSSYKFSGTWKLHELGGKCSALSIWTLQSGHIKSNNAITFIPRLSRIGRIFFTSLQKKLRILLETGTFQIFLNGLLLIKDDELDRCFEMFSVISWYAGLTE